MFLNHPYEWKQEANRDMTFPFFNKALTELDIRAGKEKLLAILNNGHNWSLENEKLFIKIVKTRIAGGKPFSVPGIQEILKAFDITTFKSQVLLLVAEKCPKLFADWALYFQLLERVPLDTLSMDERIHLSRSFYHALVAVHEKSEISQFIDLAIRLKETLGCSCFLALYKKAISPAKLSQYIKICELLISLDDVATLPIITLHLPKLDALITALEKLQKKPEEKEASLEQIIQRWGIKDDFVKFPLASTEIQQLQSDYNLVDLEAKTLHYIGASQLASEAKKTALGLSAQSAKMFRLVALVREAMRHAVGNYPYPEQTLAVLALLKTPANMKGRLAKIRTGEGKSRILAMLAAVGALQNRCVDIITSNHYLAIHAQTQFNPFFQLLGLSSGHICMEQPEQKDFNHLILYATHHDIEFSILRDETYHAERRYTTVKGSLIERPFDELWVDEVDVMLLDTQENSARIAMENPEALSWVYCPLMQFVKDKIIKPSLSPAEIFNARKDLLTTKTAEEARGFLAGFAPFKNAEREFKTTKIIHWLDSAIQALYGLQLDHDYMIKLSKIISIESGVTGRASSENCRWSHGLHEMLEIIHKLPVGEETLTCASISHCALLERYQYIGGVTGTVGSEVEREELFATYQVGSFDVPPRFPNKRVLYPPRYLQDFLEYYETIVEATIAIISQKRPVLILFETIKDTESVAKLLKSKKVMVQVINEKQQEDEEYLVSRAGHPGMVTVATFTAGRGTDILLTVETLINGGLHVIFATFTTNERPQEQGLGRAGRQGQVGSAQLILCEKQPFIQELLTARSISLVGDKDFMKKLEQMRTERVDKLSKSRRIHCQYDIIQHRILKEFWFLLKNYRSEMALMNLENIATKCTQIRFRRSLENKPDCLLLPFFQNEIHQAQELLNLPLGATAKHWLVLLKKIHERYCEKIIETSLKDWGIFFTNINDIEFGVPLLYAGLLAANFTEFLKENLLALQKPESSFLQFLTVIFKNNASACLLQEKSNSASAVVIRGVSFHQAPRAEQLSIMESNYVPE